MPSNQPPALRAANSAFHNKEESKKGKKSKPKPVATTEPQEPQPVRRRKTKSSKPEGALGKWGLGVLVFIIFGGGLIQFLYMLSSN